MGTYFIGASQGLNLSQGKGVRIPRKGRSVADRLNLSGCPISMEKNSHAVLQMAAPRVLWVGCPGLWSRAGTETIESGPALAVLKSQIPRV